MAARLPPARTKELSSLFDPRVIGESSIAARCHDALAGAPAGVGSEAVRVPELDDTTHHHLDGDRHQQQAHQPFDRGQAAGTEQRSEEHTSELQSLMRISYAVFCLKKKKKKNNNKQ